MKPKHWYAKLVSTEDVAIFNTISGLDSLNAIRVCVEMFQRAGGPKMRPGQVVKMRPIQVVQVKGRKRNGRG